MENKKVCGVCKGKGTNYSQRGFDTFPKNWKCKRCDGTGIKKRYWDGTEKHWGEICKKK